MMKCPLLYALVARKAMQREACIPINDCLEMNIARHMKAMKFRKFEEYPHSTAWVAEFVEACDPVVGLVGERVRNKGCE